MESIEGFVIEYKKTVKEALSVINQNGCGICFVVKKRKLLGLVTDGDLRRFFLKSSNLECQISEVMNKEFVYFHVQTAASIIRDSFKEDIKYIPLIDDEFNLVDIASITKTHRIQILEPDLSGNEMNYIKDCLETNWISSQGQYVKKFEQLFSELHLNRYSVSVSNGTSALHLSLKTLDIGRGDEVIIPNITFAACANAVIQAEAEPVFCEIDKKTWCIKPSEIEALITPKTKAIMVVHLYGQVADIESIKAIALKFGLYVIEDCAEAIGSVFKDKPVGVFGDVATFSFFGNKTISTGEGGMVLFKDKDFASKCRVLRDHGMNPDRKYWHDIPGYNYRLTNMQAAVGVAQLERFNSIVEKKIIIFDWYESLLQYCDGIFQRPIKREFIKHSNWLYTILLDKDFDKNKVINQLFQNGIETRRIFYPLNEMPPYRKFKSSKDLSNSNFISRHGISLPTSVNLKKEDIIYIVKCLRNVLVNY